MSKEELGGFDYELVDPDASSEFTCSICQLVARNAHQTGCCGSIFCKSCLERLIESKTSYRLDCPNCRESLSNNYFADIKSARKIRHLAAFCCNKERGCHWKGELQDVDQHMSKECPRQLIKCKDCDVNVERSRMNDHLKNKCTCRFVRCPHCGCRVKYWRLEATHLQVCPKFKVSCPNRNCKEKICREHIEHHCRSCKYRVVACQNKCGNNVQYWKLQEHVQNSCPKRIVECEYCTTRGEYQFIKGEHVEELCPYVPVPCPISECEVEVGKMFMEDHLQTCPKQLVKCKYVEICDQTMKREDEDEHYDSMIDEHFCIAYSMLEKQQNTLKQLLERKIKEVDTKLDKTAREGDTLNYKFDRFALSASTKLTQVRTNENQLKEHGSRLYGIQRQLATLTSEVKEECQRHESQELFTEKLSTRVNELNYSLEGHIRNSKERMKKVRRLIVCLIFCVVLFIVVVVCSVVTIAVVLS